MTDDIFIFLFGDHTCNMRGVCLFSVSQRNHSPVSGMTGSHIPSRKNNRGNIDSQRSHDHPRNNFVTGGHHDHPFQAVELRNGFDFTAHKVTRRKGITVSGSITADPVTNARNGQFQSKPARSINYFFHFPHQFFIKGEMAGIHLIPGINKSDNWALRIFL